MAIKAVIKDVEVGVGDTINVSVLLVEGEKTRLQSFRGVVIKIKGREENRSFVVRRVAIGNIGVERIWPVNSPWIKKIEILKKGNPRRAKLTYLKNRHGGEALKIRDRIAKTAKPKTKGTVKRKASVKVA